MKRSDQMIKEAIRRYPGADNNYFNYELQQAFMAGVIWANENPNWKDVNEELPSDKEHVIVALSNKFVTDGTYRKDAESNKLSIPKELNNAGIKVTHWMSFPKLP